MASPYNIASARAQPNIAIVKYWGNRDHRLRLPANSSLSMNLADLHTTTTVRWSADLLDDRLTINGKSPTVAALQRVQTHLDSLRRRLGTKRRAQVDSRNNFPMGAGIASSASAFAALTMAAVAALRQDMSQRELTTLARLGSGSAARSIPGGFVEWRAADSHEESYAETIAPADHWQLDDVIAIVSDQHKRVGSTSGHASASSSLFQPARVETAMQRLREAKQAIAQRDFERLARVAEADSNLMHAVMMTSSPPLFYWQPLTLAVMAAVRNWREAEGLRVCYTLDAGPNVHCICAADDALAVAARMADLSPEIAILRSPVGGGAVVLPN
ncbi:MAG: diphosphomevalonate decarboxylase [Chloroflexi bacterium]|nr:diphosphomevalonate decarboxylase [Chloroflexota bacterium]MCY4248494.1 diphosphomevalonate decarboxylase [Chloroflexota bacterium]